MKIQNIVFLAAVAASLGNEVSATNFSDQWWVPAESGWGAAVLQQSDILFIDVMVYGADGKPTWFVVAAPLQTNPRPGHTVFAGDLYSATGPYYGAGFPPHSVALRKVGTLTFDATAADAATMSYTVDGTPVVKSITRQTWRYQNISGSYYGGWNADRSNCIQGPANQTHFDEPVAITVVQNADNTVNVTLRFVDGVSESFSGTYTQSGHLGRIEGVYAENMGVISLSEIEITSSGIGGQFEGDLISARWRDWCEMNNGRLGGVLR